MPRRPRWLLPLLLVIMVCLPILEVWLLIQVGQLIGVLPTLLIVVAEVILGAWLLRREGSRAWKSLTDAFQAGRMPTGELADAALVLVGGVLLMLPGFTTDVVGLVFLLPFTRPLARGLLALVIGRRLDGSATMINIDPGSVVDGTIVDGTGREREANEGRDPGSDEGPIRGTIEPPR